MNENNLESRRYDTYMVLFYILLFSVLVIRVFYSVELTDEIHGIASIYNIYQGKAPFMTSWDYHTGWCLLAPFLWIYQKLVPDLEGIVLYFRLLYIAFIVVYLAIINRLLKKKWKDKRVWYATLPAFFYVSASLFTINYNSFVVYNFILAAVLLDTSVPKKKESLRYLILGIILGACCITYPTAAVFAVFLAGLVLAVNRKGAWKSKVCWYMLGGLATAAVFLAWVFSKGSAELFLEAMRGMLSSPHEQSKGTIDLVYLYHVFYIPLKNYVRRKFSLVIFVFGVLLFSFWQLCKKGMISGKFFERTAFGIFLLFLCCNAFLHRDSYSYVVTGMAIGGFLFVFFIKPELFQRYLIYEVFFIAYVITYAFTSDNRSILTAVSVAGPILYFVLSIFIGIGVEEKKRRAGIVFSVLLILSSLLNMYSYIYRDAPVRELTARVEHGIYRGLYTTPERKKLVEELERVLEENICKDETVCAVTRAPAIYMMSKAKICAPQTWDAQFLARGYTSAGPLLSYFEAIDETPDVLVATTWDISDFYENPKYEINSFIDQYYELYGTYMAEDVQIWLWRKK